MRIASRSLLALALVAGAGCRSAESRMATGDRLSLRGDYELALEEYQNAQERNPVLPGIDARILEASVNVQLRRGDELAATADWDEARRAYEGARQLDADNPKIEARLAALSKNRADIHFGEGQRLLGRGDPFYAIAEFEQALALEPEHPRAHDALAQARREKEDRQARAEEAFQAGLGSMAEQDFETAVGRFSAAANLNPYQPRATAELERARHQLAEALAFQGDEAMSHGGWERAVAFYRQAQTYAPSMPGLPQRIRQARREARAAELLAEADHAFQRGDWRRAYESYSQAKELTGQQHESLGRLDIVRENLATELYLQAEQAERVGNFEAALVAHREIASFYPAFRDVARRIETLDVALRTAQRAYESGRRAEEERNLRTAREKYRICAELVPHFRDVAQRRKDVEEAFERAAALYQRGVGAQGRGDAERARILLEECLAITTPYRDAADRLAAARRALFEEKNMRERYAEACRAQEEYDLRRALELFEACAAVQPGFLDIDERLRDVKAALAVAADLFERAVRAEKNGNLTRAEALYDECLAACAVYQDAEERRARARTATGWLARAATLEREQRLLDALEHYDLVLERYGDHPEARRRAAQLEELRTQLETSYTAMLEARRKGNFERAVTYARQIHERCREYRDVDTRLPVLESEVEYARGAELEDNGSFAEALELFERCAARTPGFRDVEERLASCREKLEARAQAHAQAASAPASASAEGPDYGPAQE